MPTVGHSRRSRPRAAVSRCWRTCSTRSFIFEIRVRMIRRSVSSWLSPGPREPMPPWVRDRCVHSRVRRGSWYSSWASSTWRRPSWVWACEREDVEDQPAAVDDLDVEQLLERALLGRRQLVVGDEHAEPGLALGREQVLGLALADIPVRVDVATVLPFGADDVGARGHREAERARTANPGPTSRPRCRYRRRRGTPSRRASRDR